MSHYELALEVWAHVGESWNCKAFWDYMELKSVYELRKLVASFRGGRWLQSGGWCGDGKENEL